MKPMLQLSVAGSPKEQIGWHSFSPLLTTGTVDSYGCGGQMAVVVSRNNM